MSPADCLANVITPALSILPPQMRSDEARAMLLAIAMQESGLRHRVQMQGGPARGLWQFERGTEKTRGGVTGVLMHRSTRTLADVVCKHQGVSATPDAVYAALAENDALACQFARLLLYTVPAPLPGRSGQGEAWRQYATMSWNPGKPRPEKWAGNWSAAWNAVMGAGVK